MHQKQCEDCETSGRGVCDASLCGGDDSDYACLMPPPCPTTKSCRAVDGFCVSKCPETNLITCGDERPTQTAAASVSNATNKTNCKEKGGVCTPFDVAGPSELCEKYLCDPGNESPCACLIRRVIKQPEIQVQSPFEMLLVI